MRFLPLPSPALPAVLALALGAGAALAEEADGPFKMQIEARKGIMNYMALNAGTLGAMAKGEVPYDPAAAKAAADALAAAAHLDMSLLWPKGSDNAAHQGTEALPAIWAEGSDVGAKIDGLKQASEKMQAAAGTDVEALKTAMGDLGGACTACHKAFRQAD